MIGILLLLSLPVSAWAGEPTKIGDRVNDCLMWLDKDDGIQVEGNGCVQYLQKPGCYKRMQEAMKAADNYVRGRDGWMTYQDPDYGRGVSWMMDDSTQKLWDATMKECVK